MPNDHEKETDRDSYQVAEELAARLEAAGCEYALGGAIALGFWAEARGTLDVDVTLYISSRDPAACVQLLEKIGCDLDRGRVLDMLKEHAFCQVHLLGIRLDVFLPMSAFYELAKARRREVPIGNAFDPASSDADLLVEFQPLAEGQHADAYFGLRESLAALLKRPVDLVMTGAIRNRYFLQAIEASRTLLYAA